VSVVLAVLAARFGALAIVVFAWSRGVARPTLSDHAAWPASQSPDWALVAQIGLASILGAFLVRMLLRVILGETVSVALGVLAMGLGNIAAIGIGSAFGDHGMPALTTGVAALVGLLVTWWIVGVGKRTADVHGGTLKVFG
jgi:hypothetical protein